jgi:general secretion pathway protein D
MLRKIWICLVMGLCGALLAGCSAEISHRAGMRALEERDYAEAVAKLKTASEAKPGDIEYRRDLLRAREVAANRLLATAAAASAEGKYADARRDYQTVLDFDRTNARAQAGMDALSQASAAAKDASDAREAFNRGDIERANELAGRALNIAPNEPTARAVRKEISALQVQEMLLVPGLGAMYKKPINLEFRDASIKMVFDALARTTGINFIFDRDVRGDQRTTVFLKQTTLDDAIDVILSTSQLEKKVLNASSVLIYPNTPAKAREYQDLIVRAFYMANVEAKQAANMLKTVLKLKDVYVDDRSNMLVLRESPETVGIAERLIALQDTEEPEVMLEVEVLEIDRTRLLNLGVEFPTALTVAPLGGNTSSGGSTGSTLKLSELKGLNSERIGITLPSATLNLQKLDGDANLLANPRIRVRDREKAKILIGDKVPVVTTTSSGTFVTENIQYLDVGLKLEVEPDIHLHDEIGIKVALEVSSLVSSVKTNNGSEAYQIGTRNFNSSLRLRDGETQILAGLISDEDRATANRVPLLGDLPLLGRLFSSQNTNRKKTEIVLSITPRLVRNKQRSDLAAESFWSGTEATLRNKPLQLRAFDSERASTGKSASAAAMPAAAQQATPTLAQLAPADAPKVAWAGPTVAAVGQPFSLTLDVASIEPLRAVSFQVGFNPAEFAIVSVEQGDYFNKEGKGTFTHVVDTSGGRVSLGMGAAGNASAQGAGRLITMTLKPLAEVQNGEVSLIGFTPIGTKSVLGKPNLPIDHKLTVRK